jgi:hypothetical protein
MEKPEMYNEIEITNEYGVPDTMIVRSQSFSFPVVFSVERTATMETTIYDANDNKTTYQADETYTEEFCYTFNAKEWNNSRIYITRQGAKSKIEYGYFEIATNKFFSVNNMGKSAEWNAMTAAFRTITGYTK